MPIPKCWATNWHLYKCSSKRYFILGDIIRDQHFHQVAGHSGMSSRESSKRWKQTNNFTANQMLPLQGGMTACHSHQLSSACSEGQGHGSPWSPMEVDFKITSSRATTCGTHSLFLFAGTVSCIFLLPFTNSLMCLHFIMQHFLYYFHREI